MTATQRNFSRIISLVRKAEVDMALDLQAAQEREEMAKRQLKMAVDRIAELESARCSLPLGDGRVAGNGQASFTF